MLEGYGKLRWKDARVSEKFTQIFHSVGKLRFCIIQVIKKRKKVTIQVEKMTMEK